VPQSDRADDAMRATDVRATRRKTASHRAIIWRINIVLDAMVGRYGQ
jgi:hypothetical protein